MVIDTRASLSGFIAAKPQLSQTERGDARFYARVGQERYRRAENGSFIKAGTVFHNLVMFGRAAERAYSVFRRGDRFVAEGHVRTFEGGEEFVAQRIGHDSARARYVVDRGSRSSGHDLPRSNTRQHPGIEQRAADRRNNRRSRFWGSGGPATATADVTGGRSRRTGSVVARSMPAAMTSTVSAGFGWGS